MMVKLLGIDFGTSNTSISFLENGKSKVLFYKNNNLIPSIISFNNNLIQCGFNANGNIFRNLKKFIPKQNNKLINGYNIDQLLVYYFTYLKNIIIEKIGPFKFKSVISVPSKFNNFSRNKIKRSFEFIGIDVIRIINEPTAAGLSYGLHKNINDLKILVVDIGGGTTDLTILEVDNNFFEVIDSYGNNNLGGENFNNNLINFFNKEFNIKNNDKLWKMAEKYKKKINILDEFIIKENNISIKMTKTLFKNINNNIITKFYDIFNKVKMLHIIDKIILVGGGCNLKLINEIIIDIFNIIPLKSFQLQNCVSQGCCYYAGFLSNQLKKNEDITLVDIAPLSLGIELADGNFSIIIPRNTPLPIKITKKYITDTPGDNKISIKIYQGERKMVKDNILIGEIFFDKITLSTQPIILISFKLDLNNLIQITVQDDKSKKLQDYFLNIENHLSNNDITEIVKKAELNFQQDLNISQLEEKRYIANLILEKKINQLDTNNLIDNISKKKEILKIYDIIDNLNSYDLNKLEDIIKNNLVFNYLKEDNYSEIDFSNEIISENKNILRNILNELLKINYFNENEIEFIKNTNELLELSNVNNILLENQINLYNKIKRRNYEEEFNYLIKYLLDNINNFDLNDKNKNKLYKYISEFTNNEKNYEKSIYNINQFCKALYFNNKN